MIPATGEVTCVYSYLTAHVTDLIWKYVFYLLQYWNCCQFISTEIFWRNFIATAIVCLLGQNLPVQNIVHISLSLERVEGNSLEAAGTRDSEKGLNSVTKCNRPEGLLNVKIINIQKDRNQGRKGNQFIILIFASVFLMPLTQVIFLFQSSMFLISTLAD